jgi:RecA-family ATPase
MSIVTGKDWFGHAIEQPGNVLVITAEDKKQTLRYRLQKLARAADLDGSDYAAIEGGIFIED